MVTMDCAFLYQGLSWLPSFPVFFTAESVQICQRDSELSLWWELIASVQGQNPNIHLYSSYIFVHIHTAP